MKDLFLVEPCKKYQNSFKKYASAYRKINDTHYFNKYKKALENFDNYLKDIYNCSMGINLLHGEVMTSIFWLLFKEEIVGVVRVRHQSIDTAGHIGYDISPNHRNKGYGNQILKLALKKALKLGIKEVILTCNIDNIASKKIIEKNNGKFISTLYDKEDHEYLSKYIIKQINT
ncbi:GNAT family N-acetyltransferase [Clostridiaceae bacterium M8S5]|nr:GNAT family N-acetyltransferase [Clostridiaceae bacterium M8S5]